MAVAYAWAYMIRQETINSIVEVDEGSCDIRIAASPDIFFDVSLLYLCQ